MGGVDNRESSERVGTEDTWGLSPVQGSSLRVALCLLLPHPQYLQSWGTDQSLVPTVMTNPGMGMGRCAKGQGWSGPCSQGNNSCGFHAPGMQAPAPHNSDPHFPH